MGTRTALCYPWARWFGVLWAFSSSRSRCVLVLVLVPFCRVGRGGWVATRPSRPTREGDPPSATHPGDSSDFLMSFHDFSKPKNRKMSKKIKIEKKKSKKIKKNRKSWEKRTRFSCDNLLFNSWKKYKGKILYFKLFLKI